MSEVVFVFNQIISPYVCHIHQRVGDPVLSFIRLPQLMNGRKWVEPHFETIESYFIINRELVIVHSSECIIMSNVLTYVWQDVSGTSFLCARQPHQFIPLQIESEWDCTLHVLDIITFNDKQRVSYASPSGSLIPTHPMANSKWVHCSFYC